MSETGTLSKDKCPSLPLLRALSDIRHESSMLTGIFQHLPNLVESHFHKKKFIAQMVSYRTHINEKDRNTYVYQAYMDGCMYGTSKWLIFIQNILCSQHFNQVWNHQSTMNKDRLKFSMEYVQFVLNFLKYFFKRN